jgi:choline dehydrogenase-like flavoprotein
MDHVTGGGALGELPNMNEKPNANEPDRPNGIYIPRFRNSPSVKKSSNFIRGYGYQGSGGATFNFGAEGYGTTFKNAVKTGSYQIGIGAFGESLARWDNYLEIDKTLKDAWGIPALHITMTHGENEKALMQDAAAQGAEMLEAAGAKNIKVQSGTEMPGMAIHELGTARMGNDAKKSVLTSFNQTHDVKNLFVMDGASFVSSACQNPTLTMMAITVRGCAHLIERFKTNDV